MLLCCCYDHVKHVNLDFLNSNYYFGYHSRWHPSRLYRHLLRDHLHQFEQLRSQTWERNCDQRSFLKEVMMLTLIIMGVMITEFMMIMAPWLFMLIMIIMTFILVIRNSRIMLKLWLL